MRRMDQQLNLRDRKKAETRRLILKCAAELFQEKGFAATKLEEIAEKAGVHKQTVLRYFGSKDEIALAFRQIAFQKFKKRLLARDSNVTVLEFWRDFIETSATEVARRGELLRYAQFMESEPTLLAASFAIHMQYEDLLAAEFSREAGVAPEQDLYARMLAGFLVNGNFSVARMFLNSGSLEKLVSTALAVVDFAIDRFPPRSTGVRSNLAAAVRRTSHLPHDLPSPLADWLK